MRLPQRLSLLALVLAEVFLVAGLHGLARVDGFTIDWSDLSGWLDTTPFEDAAGAVLLVAALFLAYWLLLSTVSYALASRAGSPSAMRAVGWLTLPPIRRLVSRAVALSIAASSVAGPLAPAIAKLTGTDNPAQVIIEVDSEGWMRPPGAQRGAADSQSIILPPHLTPQEEVETPDQPAVGVVDGSVSQEVTVRRGDHLWSLSESHLERVLDRTDLGEYEIARYWVSVIEANRSTIRSGDPDLIYPGEIIVMPAVGA